MINFESKEHDVSSKFKSVKENQFFIYKGYLCQKYDDRQVHIIASSSGKPYSDRFSSVDSNENVQMLPEVTKISWS